MSPQEIKNRIIQVEASIEQMKTHEHFNDMEKADNLKKLGKELEDLQRMLLNNIDSQTLDIK